MIPVRNGSKLGDAKHVDGIVQDNFSILGGITLTPTGFIEPPADFQKTGWFKRSNPAKSNQPLFLLKFDDPQAMSQLFLEPLLAFDELPNPMVIP